MAYRTGYGSRRRSSSGYGRGRAAPARRRASARRSTARGRSRTVRAGNQTVTLRIEQIPASGISRMNERVLSKMNPPPGKAKY